MLEQFHFIHPAWLLAALPLALLAGIARRSGAGGNPWRRVVDARLLPLMMAGSGRASTRSAWWLVAAGWLVAIAALADPTWQRKPQPVFQTGAARVIVLDLAQTMNDADLQPSRMARARYKVEDVLAQADEGQTGLVVYSGDAFTVAPLTRDANTIRALLKVLAPDLMPAPGSRADRGLLKAGELLRQAGATAGDVLLIADGVDPGKTADARRAAARLAGEGYRVSVLGVGAAGLDEAALRSLAQAGGGRYRTITDSGAGLQALLDDRAGLPAKAGAQVKGAAPAWQELGPAIAVLLLPLAALAFRRNWLVSAALVGAMSATAPGAMASTWSDAWQRPDQQAARALSAGDYAAAAKAAADPGRRGSAQYKLGNYALALENFAQERGADADYNRGNALARLGRYTEAVAAYDKAIAESPDNADAKANKAAVEAMLKKTPPPKEQPKPAGSQGGSKSTSPSAAGQDGKDGTGEAGQASTRGAPSRPAHADPAGGSPGSTAHAGPPQAAPSEGRSAAADRADANQPSASARAPASEEELATQQWLARIPDDPGGLLRRKFLYQYRQRAQQADAGSE